MQSLLACWTQIWSFKLSLAPVLVTYFVFDLPAIIRRVTRKVYIPIYFMFFPLGYADRMYAEYFSEDDMYGVGEAMTDEERDLFKKKVRRVAMGSMIFAAVIAPWICGIFAALFLTESQFIEFVWFLMVVKTGLICYSLLHIWNSDSFIVRSNSFKWVVLVYAAYLLLIWHGVMLSYAWATGHISKVGYTGLFSELVRYAYADLFINVVIVGVGTYALTSHFLDPKLVKPKYTYEGESE